MKLKNLIEVLPWGVSIRVHSYTDGEIVHNDVIRQARPKLINHMWNEVYAVEPCATGMLYIEIE